MHDAFTEAHWKQSVNSEMHCLTGTATGIILPAIVVSFFTLDDLTIRRSRSVFALAWHP